MKIYPEHTGSGYVYTVQPEFSISGKGQVAPQNHLGCLDSPIWIVCGSCIQTPNGVPLLRCNLRP